MMCYEDKFYLREAIARTFPEYHGMMNIVNDKYAKLEIYRQKTNNCFERKYKGDYILYCIFVNNLFAN